MLPVIKHVLAILATVIFMVALQFPAAAGIDLGQAPINLGQANSGFENSQSVSFFGKQSIAYGIGSTLLSYWPFTIILLGVLVAILIIGRRFWFSLVAALLIAIIAEQAVEFWYFEQKALANRIEATNRLSAIRSNLENVLARFLAEANAVSAFITLKPDLGREDFNAYARVIMAREPAIAAVAAAPDLVIRMAHPIELNTSAIGYDYRSDAHKLSDVMHAIESGDFSLEGPMRMESGLEVFFARAPVYSTAADGSRSAWGVVIVAIDLQLLYRKAGLTRRNTGLRIALRHNERASGLQVSFYGDKAIFDNPDALAMPVATGAERWDMVAESLGAGVGPPDPSLYLIRASGVLIAALMMMGLGLRQQQSNSRQALERAQRRNAAFMQEVESIAHVGGWRLGNNGTFTEISPYAKKLLGIENDLDILTLQGFIELFPEKQRAELESTFSGARSNRLDFDLEMPLVCEPGALVWLRIIGDPSGDQSELIGAMQDITERKQADELIEFQANFDTLTGLPNRLLFRDRLESAIAKAVRTGNRLALLFIDLDKFKSVNDNLGHSAGDIVLRETALRIRSCVRDSDSVARHSGDEFTVILPDVFSDSAIYQIVEAIVESLGQPYMLAGSEVFCGASVGVALYPDDATDADTLLINADQAMYEVKNSGRNGWHFYTEAMQQKSEYRHRLYNELIAALNGAKLSVHYQPIIRTKTGKTVACEALARWQAADGSWIPPTEFISVAEESGLINRIDYMVMERALSVIAKINRECKRSLKVSVNVSPRVFISRDTSFERWLELVRTAKGDIAVSVEITERLMIDESEKVEEKFRQIQSAGIGITIDDFGTGYSSLSYLARFPVNMLKIDRSFISAIGQSTPEETLIETIILLARQMGVEAVAEGVESEEQMEFLLHMGCEYAQGYHLGRPMDEENFRQFLINEDKLAGR